jgi:sugar (pentulose or hexulose) kinase
MTTYERSGGPEVISDGRAVLGIELGSTRIKAVLIDPHGTTLATGSHTWENQFVGRAWTYGQHDIWSGLQDSFASMCADAQKRHGVRPTALGALGISAMMHGYLAFDASGELLVPFRTWRNTSTERAATVLTDLFEFAIPLRWSVAHFYQAILDDEPHVAQVASLTTLAGYVHQRLTGRHVLGVGDASGMFPIDPATRDYDGRRLEQFDALVADRHPGLSLAGLLPTVLTAGADAGRLTADGAALLDPSGGLRPGAPLCPPEGDAGTGMVATNAVAPRTGNVSVGTSIFAMAVLESPLQRVHPEVDLVTTPAGDPVAMVHCNNGASELDAWARVFGEFASAIGHPVAPDEAFRVLLQEALTGESDAGGLLTYNYLSGEPITQLAEGRPLVLRTPQSRLTLGNFVRAQVYGAFATLSLGMRVLAGEGVELDVMVAHGGLFRTEGVAQRLLAAAMNSPVAVGRDAGEGGAWGIALLALYLAHSHEADLASYLAARFGTGSPACILDPDPIDVQGFSAYLDRFAAALPVELAAVRTT